MAPRANQTVLSMIVIDSYKLKNGCQGVSAGGARGFVEALATTLIDNDLDKRTLCKGRKQVVANEAALIQ